MGLNFDYDSVSEDISLTNFAVEDFRRYCLLNGLDDIGLTLQNEAKISEYEQRSPKWKVK